MIQIGNPLSSPERFTIPLLSKLIPTGLKFSTMLGVEFDPESQWAAVAATITAQRISDGSVVEYLAMARPREEVREHLTSIGVDVKTSEEAELLFVDDWYTSSLGFEHAPSQAIVWADKYNRAHSLKVADLSVDFLMAAKEKNPDEMGQPGLLVIPESMSVLMLFNDEKVFLEWLENRFLPWEKACKRVGLFGFVCGIHSESFYKRVENAVDGVIDLKVMERDDKVKSFLRVRSLKNQPCDTKWHEIEVKPNGEAFLSS